MVKSRFFLFFAFLGLQHAYHASAQDAKTSSLLQGASGLLTTTYGIIDISSNCYPGGDTLRCIGGIVATGVGLLQLGVAIDNYDSQNDGGAPPNPELCEQASAPPALCSDDDGNGNPLDDEGDFCSVNPQICQCTGANSASNPICNPSVVNEKTIDETKKKLTDGTIALPPGTSLEDALSALDSLPGNLGIASGVAKGTLPSSDIGKLSGVKGSGGGKTARGKSGQAGLDAFNENSGFDASAGGFGFGAGNNRPAAPVDAKGLGGTIFDGSLNVIDAETGNSLSIWERATRRFQGESLFKGRAVMMARVENIRKLARVAAQEKKAGKTSAKASKVSLAPKKTAEKPVEKSKARTPSQTSVIQ